MYEEMGKKLSFHQKKDIRTYCGYREKKLKQFEYNKIKIDEKIKVFFCLFEMLYSEMTYVKKTDCFKSDVTCDGDFWLFRIVSFYDLNGK